MDLSAEKIVKNYTSLKGSRADFDNLYQKLHNYFYVESGNITEERNKGSQLHALLDSTSQDCADVLAAGLANYLTPESAKWLFLQHSNRELRDNPEVKQWMQEATEEVLWTLSRSNFYNQMPIFYKASGVYGTAALFCEKDENDGVRFYNIPIKKLYLTEDARERPAEFYLQFEYTAEQALSRFGEKCSQEIKDAYSSGRNDDKKFKFICYFGKRFDRDPDKKDNKNMPIRMVWVDEKSKQIMQESGFWSMPCVAHRFYKRSQIVYGYSPAMKALPFARMVNTITDTMLRAAMKQADPAVALPDDAFLGTPNFNPRAINYYQRGKLNPKDEIFPIGNFGNPHIAVEHLQFYQQQIRDTMFYNTFQAFSELTKQMTVPEVMERVNEKMTLLGPAVGRFMNDVLQPLIEKVVNILYEDNRLPRMPDVMAFDPTYEVKFVGRLVQSQRQSEVNNIINALTIAGQLQAINPEVVDKINTDEAVEEIFDITGVTTRILNSEAKVGEIREQRAQAQAQAQQMLNAQAAAQAYKTAAEGDKNVRDNQSEG
ncbi:MAG: head-tail connector protein [Selenomonadaceae bacterium]|nr:head-tail connector protein [Selenomonadaceae bacterium]